MSDEYNGYLDADQTFGNYYVRELGGTFAQLQEVDPSLMLRQWWKLRKSAQNTSIGTTILGGAALAGGVLIGAPLLMGAGAIIGLGSGFLAWHHGKGATAHQLEGEVLDSCPLLVPFLCKLEESKLPRSELIATYDSFVKAVIAGHIDSTNQQQIKGWFQARIEQRAAFVQAATGFANTQNDSSTSESLAPALTDAPVEEDVKKHEVTLPQSQSATVLTDAPAADNNGSRPPTPIAPTDGAASALSDTVPGALHDRFAWAKDLLHFPAVLIWGPQGSGKTSFAAWLLHQRIAAGHLAWVCDPHKEYGQWQGLKVVGAGMDYLDCDRAMLSFASTVKQAYKARSEQPDYKPTRETVLVEEFTNWSSRCENSADFFAAALSDLRKIKKGVIFVAHDRSLVALGNAKGFSKARNNGLLELQLEARIDPATGEPMPALKGKLKYPGKAAIEVEISTEMNGSMDFAKTDQSAAISPIASTEQQLRDRLEGLYRSESASGGLPNFPEGAEAGKPPFEDAEGAGSAQEVDLPRSDDWRKYFPEAPGEVEEVIFRAYSAVLKAGKRKQDFIAEFLRGGTGGRRYQAASKYVDYLSERFGKAE